MKYEKPEIRAEAAVIAVVKGGKNNSSTEDFATKHTTAAAYEADE